MPKLDWESEEDSTNTPVMPIPEPQTLQIIRVKLSEIKIGSRMRDANPTKVDELAESIQSQGLLNPPLIDLEKNLVAGLHRLLAMRDKLKWEWGDCIISDKKDPLDLELQQIDENLVREDLHFLDKDKALARRKEIYELKHPETRLGGHAQVQPRSVGGKFAEMEKSATSENPVPSFAEETSQKTGESKRNVSEGAFRGKNLIPEAHPIIKTQERTKKETSVLARQPPKIQKRVTDLMPERPNTPLPHLIKEAKIEEKRDEIRNTPPEPPKPNMPPAECQMYWGDLFKVLAKPATIKPNSIPLQVGSPPYGNGVSQEGYVDWDQKDWESKFKKYINLAKRAATPEGIIVCVLGTQVQEHNHLTEYLPLDALAISIAREEGLYLIRRVIWTFNAGVCNNSHLNGRHETVCIWATGPGYYFNTNLIRVPAKTADIRNPPDGLVNPGDVWYFERVTNNTKGKACLKHPCIYPAELVEWIIKACSKEGDTVLDAFAGSGQTLAVASKLKRKSIGIELNRNNEVDVKIMLEGIEFSQEDIA